MISTRSLSAYYAISPSATKRILTRAGLLCSMIKGELYWPERDSRAVLNSLSTERLEKLRSSYVATSAIPEGFSLIRDIARELPSLDYGFVARSLGSSSVERVTIAPTRTAFHHDAALAHLRSVIDQRKIDCLEAQINRALRKESEQENRRAFDEMRRKPLLTLPSREALRKVVKEFEEKNPWR